MESNVPVYPKKKLNELIMEVDDFNSGRQSPFRVESISPIEHCNSPELVLCSSEETICENVKETENNEMDVDFVSLQDLNHQIQNINVEEKFHRTASLETIFEGVFLETPPKKTLASKIQEKILYKKVINYNIEKETKENCGNQLNIEISNESCKNS